MVINKYLNNGGLFILCFMLFISFSFSFKEIGEIELFVSLQGSDLNHGTKESPFNTIERAQQYIRDSLDFSKYNKITVNIRKGTYHLKNKLQFTEKDVGTPSTSIEYKAYKNEKVIISGGMCLPQRWQKIPIYNNRWKLRIGKIEAPVNQLFINGRRLSRAKSQIKYTVGPIGKYKQLIESLGRYNFEGLKEIRKKDLLPFASFRYNGNDLNNLGDLQDVEIMVYHSWESSWHQIAKIDSTNKEVYFKSTSTYPVGFFSNRNRYVIENSRVFLKNPGDWCYNSLSSEIWYVAKNNENPNTEEFVVPILDQIMILKGKNSSLTNLKFTGLTFSYSVAPRGISEDRKMLMTKITDANWLDMKTGFSGYQTASEVGAAIWLQNISAITFERCEFSKLGTYAIKVDKYANLNRFENCIINDLGGGGIILGYNQRNAPQQGVAAAASPNKNIINKCKIYNGGIIFPSAVGIAVMNATNSNIINNEIYNFGYSGISIGWSWGFGPSYTFGNNIIQNKIHDVIKILTDGGGIYTLGEQPNTMIVNNKIYNIFRSKDAIGAESNGIFFDEGSSKMFVNGNKIYHIQNKKIRFNQTDSLKIKWEK